MDQDIMLLALKIDLGINTTAYDNRLLQYLTAAAEAIKIEGITLKSDSVSDGNLVVIYAAWLWRKRDSKDGMPRMLRWQLNNRLFSERVETDG